MQQHPGDTTVSFIVPALNVEATLDSCLQAILAARSAGGVKEVLLIDNGSTDRTVEVARRRGATVISAPGLTVAAMRNLGASLAKGEILAYVDADCVIAPNWLERALVHFDDPDVGAVGSPTHVPAGATWVQHAWALHRHRHNRARAVEWLPTENLLVRKAAFREVRGFNASLVTCEDVDFCYRLGARYRILNDPQIHSIHLGEAPTLGSFFRKEAWRGSGNLAGFLSHRLRRSELPSVLMPMYHLIGALMLVSMLGYWLSGGTGLPAFAVGVMLLTPSLVLALSTAGQTRQCRWWAKLTLVYLTYAAARAMAILTGSWTVQKQSLRPLSHTPTGRPPAKNGSIV